jgi:hypothetical protein
MLDNEGYIHTLRICNTFFFCTATMVTRAHLNVTFIGTLPVLLLSLFINLVRRFHQRYRNALNALDAHRNSCACDACTYARTQKAWQCYIATFVGPLYRNCAVPRVTVTLFDYVLFGMTLRHWEIFFRRFEGTCVSHCEGSEVLTGPLIP